MTLILNHQMIQYYEVGPDNKVRTYNCFPHVHHREKIIQMLDEKDDRRAALAVKGIVQAGQVLTDSSRRLHSLFGDRPGEIRDVLSRLIDDTQLLTRPVEDMEDYILEAETVIRSRTERVGAEFSSFTLREFRDKDWLMAQVLGWVRLIEHTEAKKIDERYNYIEGTAEVLYQFRSVRILIANCGLGHPEMMPVDKSCKSCEEAQRWLWGDTLPQLCLPRFFPLGRT